MARKSLADQALGVIADIMNNPEASVAERLKAASIVLDRAPDKAPGPAWDRLDDIRQELEALMGGCDHEA